MGTVFTSEYRVREQYSLEMFGGTLSTEGEQYSLVNSVRGEQYSLGKPYAGHLWGKPERCCSDAIKNSSGNDVKHCESLQVKLMLNTWFEK